MMIFGFYVIMHGHLTPGGGFQGGAIVASALALLAVSYGRKSEKLVSKGLLAALESVGGLAFIAVAFLGIGTTFFYNLFANSNFLFGKAVEFGSNPGDLNTAGTLPLMNWAVGLKVLTGLSSVVFLMAFSFSEENDNADKFSIRSVRSIDNHRDIRRPVQKESD
jgi:multicomponent Na+:H+ antiporter subunit B